MHGRPESRRFESQTKAPIFCSTKFKALSLLKCRRTFLEMLFGCMCCGGPRLDLPMDPPLFGCKCVARVYG